MWTQLENTPELVREMVDAKRNVRAQADAAKVAEADDWMREKRRLAAERKKASAQRLRKICTMLFNGAKAHEIAQATKMTLRGLNMLCERIGVPMNYRATGRRIFAYLSDDNFEQLEHVSKDRGTTNEQTLEDLFAISFADEAHVARRMLHVKQRRAVAGA